MCLPCSFYLRLLFISEVEDLLIGVKLAAVEGHDMLFVAWLRLLSRTFRVLTWWKGHYNMICVDLIRTDDHNVFSGRTGFASHWQHCILLPVVECSLRLDWIIVSIGASFTRLLCQCFSFKMLGWLFGSSDAQFWNLISRGVDLALNFVGADDLRILKLVFILMLTNVMKSEAPVCRFTRVITSCFIRLRSRTVIFIWVKSFILILKDNRPGRARFCLEIHSLIPNDAHMIVSRPHFFAFLCNLI